LASCLLIYIESVCVPGDPPCTEFGEEENSCGDGDELLDLVLIRMGVVCESLACCCFDEPTALE